MVAALLLVSLLLAAVAVLRARPVALASPQVTSSSSAATNAGSATPGVPSPGATKDGSDSPTGGTGPAQIVVHVLGAVRRPGLVRLPERSRVEDAIEAAGGLARDAAPGQLNLAQFLADGQQVFIGTRGHPGGEVRDPGTGSGEGSGDGGGGSSGTPAKVDLNSATVAQLDAVPGVGPVTAERIVGWRKEHGRFTKVEELQEVDGIGPKTYARIAPYVRV